MTVVGNVYTAGGTLIQVVWQNGEEIMCRVKWSGAAGWAPYRAGPVRLADLSHYELTVGA